MTRRRTTLEAAYFEALYGATDDPWSFRTSAYEAGKYAATLAALGRERYGHALEVGCSIGVFTRQLASRCDRLRAIDGSGVALASARAHCRDVANVVFEQRMVPVAFPPGSYDLIVLSEVLYYLDAADLARVAAQCAASLTDAGEIVLCHWLGLTDYPLTGAQASERFAAALATRLPSQAILHDETYRLVRLSRP